MGLEKPRRDSYSGYDSYDLLIGGPALLPPNIGTSLRERVQFLIDEMKSRCYDIKRPESFEDQVYENKAFIVLEEGARPRLALMSLAKPLGLRCEYFNVYTKLALLHVS